MVLSKHLPGGSEENKEKSVKLALADIQSSFLLHTSYSKRTRRGCETLRCCNPYHGSYSSAYPWNSICYQSKIYNGKHWCLSFNPLLAQMPHKIISSIFQVYSNPILPSHLLKEIYEPSRENCKILIKLSLPVNWLSWQAKFCWGHHSPNQPASSIGIH